LDHVAADAAAVAVPAEVERIDVQVGTALVVVEQAAPDQRPPDRAEVDAVAGHDVLDAMAALEGRDIDESVVLTHHAASRSPPIAPGGWGSEAWASSCGEVVTRRCSSGAASTCRGTCEPRAKNSPSPLPAPSRNWRSWSDSWKASTTGPIVLESCSISSLMAALVSTVRPWTESRKSLTSWVTVTRPR